MVLKTLTQIIQKLFISYANIDPQNSINLKLTDNRSKQSLVDVINGSGKPFSKAGLKIPPGFPSCSRVRDHTSGATMEAGERHNKHAAESGQKLKPSME